MDFSQVKKLVIPEGEVQSITIADKVVWTKPEDKKWNVIQTKTTLRTSYSQNNQPQLIVTADLTKSKLFRFSINPESRITCYKGVDTLSTEEAPAGITSTFEISLDASKASTTKQLFAYYYEWGSSGNWGVGWNISVEISTGRVSITSWYNNTSQPSDKTACTFTLEQYY